MCILKGSCSRKEPFSHVCRSATMRSNPSSNIFSSSVVPPRCGATCSLTSSNVGTKMGTAPYAHLVNHCENCMEGIAQPRPFVKQSIATELQPSIVVVLWYITGSSIIQFIASTQIPPGRQALSTIRTLSSGWTFPECPWWMFGES